MANIKTELEPLLGAKLVEIIFKEDSSGFVLMFDNGRTFTAQSRMVLTETKLVADLRVICGYY